MVSKNTGPGRHAHQGRHSAEKTDGVPVAALVGGTEPPQTPARHRAGAFTSAVRSIRRR